MSDNFENNNGFDENNDPSAASNQGEQSVNQNEDVFSSSAQNDSGVFETTAEEKPTEQNEFDSSNAASNQGSSFEQTPYSYNGYRPQQPQNGYSNANQNGAYYGANPQNPQNGASAPYNFGGGSNFVPPQGGVPNSPKKKSSKGKVIAAVVIAVVIVVGIAIGVASLRSPSKPQVSDQTTVSGENANGETAAPTTNAAGTNQLQFSTTDSSKTQELSAVEVADKARASVVGVMTYQNSQLSGEGSGVVMGVDSTGKYTYVITCAHVISESGATYGVSTLDGKKYSAELVAYDTRTDIGVLKVEATDLPIAEFGDSSTLKVGETVYAIGNPGGSDYFGSMTNGIVSAIDRSVSGTYTMTCIQHNAAINPGNSGGALVNSAGQVIGINSSKIAATDYEGMGFAIPIATVKTVVDNLIAYGYVPNRPKLGIQYASVDNYQLYSMVVAIKNLPSGSLVITGISNDSSLANTNAQVGDLIVGVNGKKMDTSDVLLDLINTGAVGDKITLNLCRVENRTYKTTEFDVTITLVEDKGDSSSQEETTTAASSGDYNYGGASSFEDFFKDYFGNFGGFGN